MKFMSFLLISVFFFFSCGKKQVKSLSDEQVSSSGDIESLLADLNFDVSKKFSLAVVIEDDVPKCQFSLEGKPESVPSFAEVYPVGDPAYSKRIVSSELAKSMTEEERKELFIVPPELADLPDCDVEDEADVAQMVPNMTLTDGTEEVASVRVANSLLGNAFSCLMGYVFTWGLTDWYTNSSTWNNFLASIFGGGGTFMSLFTYMEEVKKPAVPAQRAVPATASTPAIPAKAAVPAKTDSKMRLGLRGLPHGVGALICGAAGTATGLAFINDLSPKVGE